MVKQNVQTEVRHYHLGHGVSGERAEHGLRASGLST